VALAIEKPNELELDSVEDEPAETLSALPVGASAIVRQVRGERRTTIRLLEMGLLPGTRVRVARVAPLGDPLELRLRGYTLSIRRAEAAAVAVTRERGPDGKR
jgi:Fe2+ transport system protein FeoA